MLDPTQEIVELLVFISLSVQRYILVYVVRARTLDYLVDDHLRFHHHARETYLYTSVRSKETAKFLRSREMVLCSQYFLEAVDGKSNPMDHVRHTEHRIERTH